MKIDSENGYDYYEINNIMKFDLISEQIRPLIKKCIANSPYYKATDIDTMDMFRTAIYKNDPKFKLWIIMKGREVVSFFSSFIITDSDGDRCLLYAAYVNKGMIHKFTPIALHYLSEFAKSRHCKSIMFFTALDDKILGRLFRAYKFQKTRSVFEMEIEHV